MPLGNDNSGEWLFEYSQLFFCVLKVIIAHTCEIVIAIPCGSVGSLSWDSRGIKLA